MGWATYILGDSSINSSGHPVHQHCSGLERFKSRDIFVSQKRTRLLVAL
jgi:hypothetical protein